MQFVVTHDGNLLASLVTSFIRELYPDHEVRLVPAANDTHELRISLEGTTRWIHLTAVDARQSMVQAILDGATAVLSLDSSEDDFRAALTALAEGGRSYVPLPLMQWMAGQANGHQETPVPDAPVHLTRREQEVLNLVAIGCTNRQIARRLQISANTVRTHLHSLNVKLDAPSRLKMVATAQSLGLLDVSRPRPEHPHTVAV